MCAPPSTARTLARGLPDDQAQRARTPRGRAPNRYGCRPNGLLGPSGASRERKPARRPSWRSTCSPVRSTVEPCRALSSRRSRDRPNLVAPGILGHDASTGWSRSSRLPAPRGALARSGGIARRSVARRCCGSRTSRGGRHELGRGLHPLGPDRRGLRRGAVRRGAGGMADPRHEAQPLRHGRIGRAFPGGPG